LVLRLKAVPLPPNRKYTLNHYPKALVEKTFSDNTIMQVNQATAQNFPGIAPMTHIWQLVPDIFNLDMEMPIPNTLGLAGGFMPERLNDMCWQQDGYWHIARAQVHCKKYGTEEYYYNDLANNLRTGHLDLTFQPTFYAIPYRDFAHQNDPVMHNAGPPGPGGVPNLPNVRNLLGGEFEDEWKSTLSLEKLGKQSSQMLDQTQYDENFYQNFDHSNFDHSNFDHSMDQNLDQNIDQNFDDQNFRRELSPDLQEQYPVKRVRISESSQQSAPWNALGYDEIDNYTRNDFVQDASNPILKPILKPIFDMKGMFDDNDIGVLSDAGPLLSRPALHAELPETVPATAERQTEPPSLNIPKPGVRGTKRGPARKGVLSSVLAADGSVTQERSNML